MMSRLTLVAVLLASACLAGCSRDAVPENRGAELGFRIAVDPALDHADAVEQLVQSGPEAQAGSDYAWFRVNDLPHFVDDDRVINDLVGWVAESSNSDADIAASGRQMVLRFFDGARGIVACPYLGEVYVLLHNQPGLMMTRGDGWDLRYARRDFDALGRPCINFMLDEPGAELMREMTKSNVSAPLGVLVEGVVITTPIIRSPLSDSITITGDFTPEQLDSLIESFQGG